MSDLLKCETCDFYETVTADGKGCKFPACLTTQKITLFGMCKDCPDNQRATFDNKDCTSEFNSVVESVVQCLSHEIRLEDGTCTKFKCPDYSKKHPNTS